MILIIFTIALGLIAGSFLTVFIDRFHDGRNYINSRSSCNDCKKKLNFLDLIPLFSYIFSRGKCRHCQKDISLYYPLVEIATTISFVLFYAFWPFEFEEYFLILFFIWLIILTLLLALTIYDFKWMLLPSKIIYTTIAVGLIALGLRLIAGDDLNLLSIGLGILLGGGIFHIIFIISDKFIGYGDVRLGFLLGILLADWQLSILMIFLSSILGILFTLPLIIIKGKKVLETKFKIPFGPFLILGSLICFCFGRNIVDWYINLGI